MAAIDGLPDKALELVEVIGLEAALKLVKARRGTDIWIPATAHDTHWLAVLVGMAAFKKLVGRYGYTVLSVPSCGQAIKTARNAKLVADSGTLTHWQLAIKYQLNQRTVRRVLKHGRQAPRLAATAGSVNFDLFEFV